MGVLLAVTLAVAASGAPAASAGAATGCPGVTVTVEFHQLHHGDVNTCLPEGAGHNAARLLSLAGLSLTDVQSQPGFVCRVDGLPADDPCVTTPSASRYWSLWWSRGSGPWVYSTVQASSLQVPAGGAVGLVWDQDPGNDPPPTTDPAGATDASGPATTTTPPTASASQTGTDDALPAWVAPLAIGSLLALAGVVALVRRRAA